MTAEVISYRPRSAVRDVGKALGLSLDRVDALAKTLDRHCHGPELEQLRRGGHRSGFARWADSFWASSANCSVFLGIWGSMSAALVITRGPLCELVPIENAAMAARTVIRMG